MSTLESKIVLSIREGETYMSFKLRRLDLKGVLIKNCIDGEMHIGNRRNPNYGFLKHEVQQWLETNYPGRYSVGYGLSFGCVPDIIFDSEEHKTWFLLRWG